MGPYCSFCNTRCFVHIPKGASEKVYQAYQLKGLYSPIIATCKGGQEFEMIRFGQSYDTIKAEIEREQAQTQTFIKSYGVAKLSPTAFTLDLSHAPNPHIALFQLANILEQHTGYWLDFREAPNGRVTEWMLMDKHGTAHKATGTPRTVVIPLA